jgi:DNA-binding beta-propeller fold protein YncE
VNQDDGTVSIVSLGPVRNLHITESSPTATVTSASPLTLTLDGTGFVNGSSQVLLDNVALPAGEVSVVSPRQIVATIPASFLTAPRRYSVTVENPAGGTISQSNEEDLTVIQPVTVGTTAAAAPFGVAVDTSLDLAVVSNFGENSVSFVDLNHGIQIAPSPEPVGANPEGVAVLPRSSLAIVADSTSNQVHIIDETGINAPVPANVCGSLCSQPTGVGVNGDTGEAAVANFVGSSSNTPGAPNLAFNFFYSFVTMSLTSPTSGTSGITLDLGPNDVAFDPNLNYAAFTTTVGTGSPQTGFVDIVDFTSSSLLNAVGGLTRPTGVVYDPLNQVFLVSDNGANVVDIIDPKNNAFTSTAVQTGIGPTALDYNYNTSTLITSNYISNSMTLLDYLCPPTGIVAECTGPRVRRIIALPNSPQFSVAVDPKLSLAVVVDQQDNRVLLVPLP